MKNGFLLLALLGASSYAQTGTFAETGRMISPRFGHTATLLPNGKVLIAGGSSLDNSNARLSATATLELYDPATGTFTATGKTASPIASATLLPDGRVLLIESRNAELYDPSTGTVTATGQGGNLPCAPRCGATLLTNGKVLMTSSGNPQLYDPSTDAFTLTGPYANVYTHNEEGFQTTVTLLPSGEVLFAEDSLYRNYSAELYDSTTNTFRLTGAMVSYLLGRTTTLLVNGKVLRAGGFADFFGVDDPYNKEEQYDPATGMFTATGNMMTPRSDHVAVLLPDSTVLVTGGVTFDMGPDVFRASAELYDSSTGTFTATGNMTARRRWHTATVLNDGRVLITGGIAEVGTSPSFIQSNAEIYTPPVLIPAPALFSLSGDGQGQGAIWHAQTGQIASAGNPAVAGEVLSMYTTSLANGGVIPPQVSIGGRLAQVLYFGASGYPGYNQVNFRVPNGVAPGLGVPVRLTYLSRPSNAVTIAVQ
jgi:hypothetical protein